MRFLEAAGGCAGRSMNTSGLGALDIPATAFARRLDRILAKRWLKLRKESMVICACLAS